MAPPSRRTVRAAVAAVVVAALAAATPPAGAARAWTIVPSPNPGAFHSISGLIAFSRSEIWAIGTTSDPAYAGCKGRTLTARFNGTAFQEVPGGGAPICASVNGVAGISTHNIWAVGSTNEGRDTHIRHWNGTDWRTVPGATIPVPSSGARRHGTTSLNAVAAVDRADIWAVGRTEFEDFSRGALVEHWDGSRWTLVPVAAGPAAELNGVAAVGAADVWAVGRVPTSAGGQTLVEHWDGAGWSRVPSPNADVHNVLRGVDAVSATDVWAVGESVDSFAAGVPPTRALVEHWDGTAWSIVPSPNVGAEANALVAVAARGAADVWAVGRSVETIDGIPTYRTLTMHWDGVAWTIVPSPSPGAGDAALSAVAVSGAAAAWTSGFSSAGTLVERFG